VTARRLLFWGGVAFLGGIMTPFGLALVASKSTSPGLTQFRNFLYGAS